jgi:hypothetical protein
LPGVDEGSVQIKDDEAGQLRAVLSE